VRSADYPFELGRVEFAAGRFDESIPLFRRALAMDENHLLSQLYLGSALIRTNRLDEAIAQLNASITRNPSNGDLQRLLVAAQQRVGGS
jgi:predicted Zn-dependent protease